MGSSNTFVNDLFFLLLWPFCDPILCSLRMKWLHTKILLSWITSSSSFLSFLAAPDSCAGWRGKHYGRLPLYRKCKVKYLLSLSFFCLSIRGPISQVPQVLSTVSFSTDAHHMDSFHSIVTVAASSSNHRWSWVAWQCVVVVDDEVVGFLFWTYLGFRIWLLFIRSELKTPKKYY